MKNLKETIKNLIETNGLGIEEVNNVENVWFTFTSIRKKDFNKIKKTIEKTNIEYEESFELDGGDPYYMIDVKNSDLREFIK